MGKSAQGKTEPLSFIITGDGLAGKQTAEKELRDINLENSEKLAEMTKEELLQEQKKLESSLGMLFSIIVIYSLIEHVVQLKLLCPLQLCLRRRL